MKILVTGTAGFIGSALAKKLLESNHCVIGVDNFNDYYDVQLKHDRTARLARHSNFKDIRIDLQDSAALERVFSEHQPSHIVNLAAQAGVRHSLEKPQDYIDTNITGFLNILECCRRHPVKHLVYASSSSVYGTSTEMPFSTHNSTDHPASLYAASKKSNELMAHSYSHLFNIPTTGLRFFSAYGPWGRPDMALFIFTRKILAGQAIDIFNNGHHRRDFTYIDDIVEGIICCLSNPPQNNINWDSSNPDPAHSAAPYKLYNIGNNRPIALMEFIEILELKLGVKAKKNFLTLQPGDVANSFADISPLAKDTGYKPTTSLHEGISRFVAWYKEYYKT